MTAGGPLDLEMQPIAMDRIVKWALAIQHAVDRQRVDYRCMDDVVVLADGPRLGAAIASLLHVTLTSAPNDARLSVRVSESPSHATLTILVPGARRQDTPAVAVARSIVQAHRGLLAIVELDDATLWCVELPIYIGRTDGVEVAPSVLLVDDNINQVTVLAEKLRGDGLDVKIATSGAEALVRVASSRPDLLVVDLQLRGMHGAELIRRAREHASDVPAVVISGYPEDHPLTADAISATGCAYLPKPVAIDALVALAWAAHHR